MHYIKRWRTAKKRRLTQEQMASLLTRYKSLVVGIGPQRITPIHRQQVGRWESGGQMSQMTRHMVRGAMRAFDEGRLGI